MTLLFLFDRFGFWGVTGSNVNVDGLGLPDYAVAKIIPFEGHPQEVSNLVLKFQYQDVKAKVCQNHFLLFCCVFLIHFLHVHS